MQDILIKKLDDAVMIYRRVIRYNEIGNVHRPYFGVTIQTKNERNGLCLRNGENFSSTIVFEIDFSIIIADIMLLNAVNEGRCYMNHE